MKDLSSGVATSHMLNVSMHLEKMDDEETKYCVCYYAEQNAKSIALSLLSFGHEVFAKAYHIQNISLLKDVVDSIPINSHETILAKLNTFLFENLMDAVKISICFENYMKAKLLLNGFIIHRISGIEKFKGLRREQAKRPIELREIRNICNWEKFKETDDYYLNALTNQTIQFNTLIDKPRYQKYIGLPSDIKDIVSRINKQRNRLHFLTGEYGNYGQTRINELADLINFMDTDFRILQNELVDVLGELSDKKIKKRHANNT